MKKIFGVLILGTLLSGCEAIGLGESSNWGGPIGPTKDQQIAAAKSVCTKVGLTPGTDRFIDCTIKMLSTSTGQQTVIVGTGQRRSIYPLHCRQMGGASNC